MKVQGRYLVSWENQNDTENKYTLTGNDRHAKIRIISVSQEEFKFVSISGYGYRDYGKKEVDTLDKFPGRTGVRINRAMAILNGAEGARPALDDVAMQASIIFQSLYQDTPLTEFSFRLPKYNEWFPLAFELPNTAPYRGVEIGGRFVFNEELDAAGNPKNYFTIDDYNLQDAYIGQDIFPNLILDVQCAGMMDFENRML